MGSSVSVEPICVDPARIGEIWPHVRVMLAAAFATPEGRAGDTGLLGLERELRGGEQLLWIAWDGRQIVAAATTKIITSRRGHICLVTAASGLPTGDVVRWREYMHRIETFARAEGCVAVRLCGRRAWCRVLPDYAEPWVTLEKSLA